MSGAKRKSERVRGRRGRIVGVREVRQRFLIVCEGSQTEPNYFRAFQVAGCVVEIQDTSRRGEGLIREAIRRRDGNEYDQVWCVFDHDDLQPHQIIEAIRLAEQSDINIAFSNQAFELWYLLHFDYHNTAMTRRDYCKRLDRYLQERLRRRYKKNSTDMYQCLLRYQQTAIDNARRLHQGYNPWSPVDADPSTTVYLLVEALNRHRRP
ncbi:RloB family protein [Roseiflexus sp.]|uniref:RloB family protein n=1 Tax=Roseiflexus sp. TaxID=2562120 RepID=UPI00398B43D7